MAAIKNRCLLKLQQQRVKENRKLCSPNVFHRLASFQEKLFPWNLFLNPELCTFLRSASIVSFGFWSMHAGTVLSPCSPLFRLVGVVCCCPSPPFFFFVSLHGTLVWHAAESLEVKVGYVFDFDLGFYTRQSFRKLHELRTMSFALRFPFLCSANSRTFTRRKSRRNIKVQHAWKNIISYEIFYQLPPIRWNVGFLSLQTFWNTNYSHRECENRAGSAISWNEV